MATTTANDVRTAFRAAYGRDPEVITRAPGRLEILGNHTDYNDGLVLSAAIDRATYVAAARRPGKTARIEDIRNDTARTFNVDELAHPEPGDWSNYVRGIVVELQRRHVDVPAFDAIIASEVPMAVGLSSSAALEISVAYALGSLAGVGFDWREWALIGQACENRYVGAMTGLLDQFSSIRGRDGHFVLSDFRSLDVTTVPVPDGVSLVVANSMVRHNLTGAYNERRRRCGNAVASLREVYRDVTALRDVSVDQLRSVRDDMATTSYLRALHVVGEIERVETGVAALQSGDLARFGRLMFESHESSKRNFENSCPELDALVNIAASMSDALGARLSGGGFGGVTVHLVRTAAADAYARQLKESYRDQTGREIEVMTCRPAAGAAILECRTAGLTGVSITPGPEPEP